MASLPSEKYLRKAPHGQAIFCTLNGTPILQANLSQLGGTQIVDWVRKETGIRRLHVVQGTVPVNEGCTFHQLRDKDYLNIIFDATDLPVLEVHAVGFRGNGRVDIDLAHHRFVEDLQSEMQEFMQRLPCARWRLEHEILGHLLQSDKPPPRLFLEEWIALLRWQGPKRIKVLAKELLPRVCIRFEGGEEQWVDLEGEQILTCTDLLAFVRKLAQSLLAASRTGGAGGIGGSCCASIDKYIFRLQRKRFHGCDSCGQWIADDDRYRHLERLSAHNVEDNEVLHVTATLLDNGRKRKEEVLRLGFDPEANERGGKRTRWFAAMW
mmetsp:Transcript_17995/g.42034  ORF Transcript_17995/g.42034 Transcript_17995/m.42034 type:complete len:323 (-) Transcript_17995:71-1039(-)